MRETREVRRSDRRARERGERPAVELRATGRRQGVLDRKAGELVPEGHTTALGDEDSAREAFVGAVDGVSADLFEQPRVDSRGSD